MTELAGFSDWALSLLPRLFLYPGGVWLLAALLWLRLASSGPTPIRPAALVADLLKASLPALAVGWAALALISLPGASPLAAPIDRLILAALPLVSLALSGVDDSSKREEGWIGAGITLALLSPLTQGQTLLLLSDEAIWGVSSALSVLSVALGLAALSTAIKRDMSGAVRWLAWLGLGLAPVWTAWAQPPLPGIYWTSLVYTFAIAILAIIGKFMSARIRNREAVVTGVWALAVLSLLAALLRY